MAHPQEAVLHLGDRLRHPSLEAAQPATAFQPGMPGQMVVRLKSSPTGIRGRVIAR